MTLLAHEFFMNDGFMGEWVKSKVLSAVAYLEGYIANPKAIKIGLNKEWSKEKLIVFIEMIGEPLIKNSIKDLYFRAFGKKDIQKEIDRLNQLMGEGDA